MRIAAGSGEFTVNDKNLDDYFTRFGDSKAILAPFEATGQATKSFDISVHVNGGGVTGQRDAIQLGIARALVKMDEDSRHLLRAKRFMTRDPRVKERKKPGLKRARKAPTYTKR
ncbi:MAG: 30S ribosomal protein S9 [Anaerolineaceae bacterium]|nr:30S ribosomal protein S9 [Anaerolineaceae bacterium]